jgi:uroporphyrinogen-III synthase
MGVGGRLNRLHSSMTNTTTKRVCFFKPEKENDSYRSLFAEAGYEVQFEAVLDFEFENKEKLRASLLFESSGAYDALIATSPRTFEAIKRLLSVMSEEELSKVKTGWKSRHLFVVGQATLSECPLTFDHVHNVDSDAIQLANVIKEQFSSPKPDSSPWRLLFPCSQIRRDVLPTMLRDDSCQHLLLDEITAYSTKKLKIELSCDRDTWWVFFSPSGVEAVFASMGSNLDELLLKLRIASIGQTTADSLAKIGVKPQAIAAQPNANALLIAIQNADLQ